MYLVGNRLTVLTRSNAWSPFIDVDQGGIGAPDVAVRMIAPGGGGVIDPGDRRSAVLRSLRIGAVLCAISNAQIRAAELDSPGTVIATLPLPAPNE